jgi:4-amino-4-deoxychorismate lyase
MPDPVLVLLDRGAPRLADPSAPVLRADDLGVLRGESVFETVRIAGGRPAFLAAHLRRLQSSADRLEIALPGGWVELVALALAHWPDADGILRLVCSKGPAPVGPGAVGPGAVGPGAVGFGLLTPMPAETVAARAGVTAITLTLGVPAGLREGAPWLLGGVKSTSYAANMASQRHARDLGADGVVWVSSDGEVLEAPTSTVAWIAAGRLVTPPPSVGILPGTTLQAVLDLQLVDADVRRGTVAELRAAEEVLLLSSGRGIAPVVRLDDVELGVGPVTQRLQDAFEAAVQRAG